ncbi:MAG: hypothetical protein BGN88_02440 [Clostridiales bacterium 43-6]|nr:MAG: hypothetical protein BGN88_02440 [Clostridiales bacterium 43-6]
MIDKEKLNELVGMASDKLGTSRDNIEKAMNSGSLDKILGNLKPGDAARLQNVLKDKAATEKLLSTPQAQQLLKKIIEGK